MPLETMAGSTGLEPATSGLTGRAGDLRARGESAGNARLAGLCGAAVVAESPHV